MKTKRLLIDVITLFLVFSLGAGLGVFGCFAYAGRGRTEKSARFSTLRNVQGSLLRYAQAQGRYPDRLEDAMQPGPFPRPAELVGIEYYAAGRKYPLETGELVFVDRVPRRYGFIEGRFEFSEREWYFQLDYSGRRE